MSFSVNGTVKIGNVTLKQDELQVGDYTMKNADGALKTLGNNGQTVISAAMTNTDTSALSSVGVGAEAPEGAVTLFNGTGTSFHNGMFIRTHTGGFDKIADLSNVLPHSGVVQPFLIDEAEGFLTPNKLQDAAENNTYDDWAYVQSHRSFADCHVHFEFLPQQDANAQPLSANIMAGYQNDANGGLYVGGYELQVLGHSNPYIRSTAGAGYNHGVATKGALFNGTQHWTGVELDDRTVDISANLQSYDVFMKTARLDLDGNVLEEPKMMLYINGQPARMYDEMSYANHSSRGAFGDFFANASLLKVDDKQIESLPVILQRRSASETAEPPRYKNIWVQELSRSQILGAFAAFEAPAPQGDVAGADFTLTPGEYRLVGLPIDGADEPLYWNLQVLKADGTSYHVASTYDYGTAEEPAVTAIGGNVFYPIRTDGVSILLEDPKSKSQFAIIKGVTEGKLYASAPGNGYAIREIEPVP